jgi:hypothetical protein
MKDSSLILQLSQHKREHTKKVTHPIPFFTKLKKKGQQKRRPVSCLYTAKGRGGQGMEPVPNVEKGNFN